VRSLGTQAIWQRRTTFGAMTRYTLRPRIERDPDLVVVAGDEALLTAATVEGMTLAAVG
jgi:hypothetical protein